jgi:hypothetical protein
MARRGKQGVEELLHDNRRLRDRVLELEAENHHLASLYVASVQLHATLEPAQVVRTIVEILENFVGARTFALYLVDERAGRLRAVAVHNAEPALGEPGLGEQALAERPSYADLGAPPLDPTRAAPPVVVPLRLGRRAVGAIAVWELLSHKPALDDVDHRLFDLLAGGKPPRRAKPVEPSPARLRAEPPSAAQPARRSEFPRSLLEAARLATGGGGLAGLV